MIQNMSKPRNASTDMSRRPDVTFEAGWISVVLVIKIGAVENSSQPQISEGGQDEQGDQPPEPVNSAGHDFFSGKLALDKFVVVKIFIRQPKLAGIGGFRPAGLFIRAAFGTGSGVARHIRAAVRT